MELLIFWLIFAGLSAIAANARGRSALAWTIWGLIFGVFALIAVLIMPNLARQASRTDAEARIAELERKLSERDRQDSPPPPKDRHDDSRPGPWG